MAEKHNRSAVLAHRRYSANAEALAPMNLRDRFVAIHDLNLWGADTSVWGVGSEFDATASIRSALSDLITRLGIQSLLDAPCGDASWIKLVNLGLERYIGADIVPALVEKLSASAASNERFILRDITTDDLPAADAILCRDCLVHLSFENIRRALLNFQSTGARWLLVTTFPELGSNENCADGDWRGLNFERSPFNWPAPLATLDEHCDEGDGAWADKSLGLWELDRLRL